MPRLIDTHTHFDVPEYDHARQAFNQSAKANGVQHLVLIGYLAKYFDRMVHVKQMADTCANFPKHHLAFGLHPLYIKEQSAADLQTLADFVRDYPSVAMAEIGLDTYPNELKTDTVYQKQQAFFVEQLTLAKSHDLPIMLHIRKAHADVLKILKTQKYNAHDRGGIAHSFSGGENEAIAFVKMGFKLGITGQITNPNAKKLRNSVKAVFDKFGTHAFVIETDCPDMLPIACQSEHNTLNEPKNLPHVLHTLAKMFETDHDTLAHQLWDNSNQALHRHWQYNDEP
ncbi:MAG: TatD family hydrolase [Moraxella sp.]|nr:TatD family hydrolase [Moraxella sp.]